MSPQKFPQPWTGTTRLSTQGEETLSSAFYFFPLKLWCEKQVLLSQLFSAPVGSPALFLWGKTHSYDFFFLCGSYEDCCRILFNPQSRHKDFILKNFLYILTMHADDNLVSSHNFTWSVLLIIAIKMNIKEITKVLFWRNIFDISLMTFPLY